MQQTQKKPFMRDIAREQGDNILWSLPDTHLLRRIFRKQKGNAGLKAAITKLLLLKDLLAKESATASGGNWFSLLWTDKFLATHDQSQNFRPAKPCASGYLLKEILLLYGDLFQRLFVLVRTVTHCRAGRRCQCPMIALYHQVIISSGTYLSELFYGYTNPSHWRRIYWRIDRPFNATTDKFAGNSDTETIIQRYDWCCGRLHVRF